MGETENSTTLVETDDGEPYGDLYVSTAQADYIFKRVFACYEVVARMICYMDEHRFDPVIYVDLEKLCADGMGFKMIGDFVIERHICAQQD